MKRLIPLVIVAGFVLAAGCKGSATTIYALTSDPGQYDHQTVSVAGKVIHAVSVMGYGAFQIDDGTGQITVVTKENGAPRVGAEVGVTGEFRSAFTLGTETVAAIIEKKRSTASK